MSTGSYDDASNLVKGPTSPLSLGAEADDVFDKLTDAASGYSDGQSKSQNLPITKGSRSPSPKHSPFKKSKASKGLGFLIKAREGAKKGSKSPLSFKSSKSKKKKDEDFFEDLGAHEGQEAEIDETVKAKSEHWQAFMQMQDRIKQNVLKTQNSIGKLATGRVSPSGRISPGKGKEEDDQPTGSNIRFVNLNEEQDSGSFEQATEQEFSSQPFSESETTSGNVINYYESSDLSKLISLPHFTVSSPSAFQTTSVTDTKFSMDSDAFGDILGPEQHNNTPVNTVQQRGSVDEFDLLGLSSEPAPVTNSHQLSTQSSLNEDLLGLDDFVSIPASRDLSQENLATDWWGSSAQSSAQSSLCPSPVQFDLDVLTSQGKLVPESTAVSDLARSLVDDFLLWGAGNSDEPLSKNPFQSDDFTSDQDMKPNAFNPFATIVESDDPDSGSDFLGGFSDKTPSGFQGQDKKNDPFETDNDSAAVADVTSAFSSLDPFAPHTTPSSVISSEPLDINANAAPSVSAAAPPPPLRPAQHTHTKKQSRKSSNPFLISDDDFTDGTLTFDDNFFASRGIFHASAKDDSIWGVSSSSGPPPSSSGTSGGTSANPFQDDLFTSDNIPSQKDQPDGFGDNFGEVASIAQPINPFLTASFENIASNAQGQPLSADNPFAAMVGDKSPALSPVPSPARSRTQSPSAGLDDLLGTGLDSSAPKETKPIASNDLNFDPFSKSSENVESLTNEGVTDDDLIGGQNGSTSLFGQSAKQASIDMADDDDFTGKLTVDIKEKSQIEPSGPVPMLPPPPKAPKSPQMPQRENPFNKESPPEENFATFAEIEEELKRKAEAEAADASAAKEKRDRMKSITSEDSTPEEEGPLEPLEPFHLKEEREFWKLLVRQPTKKKLAGNRFWKMTIVRLGYNKDGCVIRLYMEEKDTEPFQELPLQPCYSISDISMQQYDQFGKIHTVKIQYIFYRERVGIRPERITPSFVRKPKPNMILDHAPQVSELIKLGSLDIDEITSFVWSVEDALMKLECHRDKTLTYTKDEVQAEVWDEYQAVIDKDGHVVSQKARVRIFFLAFLTGMPACELGISDRRRKGKEVVGRHDIIPVRTEDWIRIEEPEFHHVVDLETYEKTHNIRFHPLDACQFELVRFRVRPRENRELPLQLRITQVMKGRHFEVRVDLLVTGYHAFSKKCGQFPCEDIEVRIKIPEVWIYYFRYEKRFGYGSLKAMARKPGKIKGLERITMMAQGLLSPALMEASVGSAKYEHLYRSVVWRIPRLPERNHGAYKNHLFVLHLSLGQHDEVPDQLEQWADCSFTMPASTVSKAQVRSISVDNPDPPEKWVRYIAKYNYKVEIDNQIETESDKDTSD